jgi:hypothetical protein
MPYYSKKEYKFVKYAKSTRKHKKYSAMLKNKNTDKTVVLHFGDNRYENFHDLTGLNLYPSKIHGDPKRRKSYKARHKKDIKDGYFSSGYYSYNILW